MSDSEVVEPVKVEGAAEKILGWKDSEDGAPQEFFDWLRGHRSPIWDPKAQAWLVLDFDQCLEIEASEEHFGNIYMNSDPILLELKGGKANVTVSQGELHKRLRKFHLVLLSHRAMQSYLDKHILPIIDFALDRIADHGKADLRKDYVQQVVPRVICSLMGMPWRDDDVMARILQLNDDIVKFIGNNYRGEQLRETALAASKELNEMLLPYIRERRDHPADDFISRVWTEAPGEYGEMTEEDAIAICRELYFAASDTTNHGSSNMLYLLLSDEKSRKQAYADRETLKNLVEEGMRLYNVVQMRHRLVRHDMVFEGCQIKEGDLVLLVHAAANRDPAKYKCPHEIDLNRRRPGSHIAFGRGPRQCLGNQLARTEMIAMLNAVMDRLQNVRFDPDAEPPSFGEGYMRSYKPLNVIWDA